MVRLIREWSYTNDEDQVEINGYYISIKSNPRGYTVQACPMQGNDMCGYPEVQNTYGTYEQAKRRFNALRRKYSKLGERL